MAQAAQPSKRDRLRQWLAHPRNSPQNHHTSSTTSTSLRNFTPNLNAASLTSRYPTSSPSSPLTTSVAPNTSNGPPAAVISNLPSATSTVSKQNFKDRVFLRLSQLDQDTIGHSTVSNAKDIDEVVQRALEATKEKQAICRSKRWTFKFRGQEVVLRETADKIVKWLDRLKQVGDATSNVDPVHIGLPWVGIRLLLEVGVVGYMANI